MVAGWIEGFAGNDPNLILFALVAVFVIVGDFIEPIPAIIIFMPVVNALTEAGDINAVHMGVVLIVTLAFGLITPPYGLALLMASKFRRRALLASALRLAADLFDLLRRDRLCDLPARTSCSWLPKHVLPESVGCSSRRWARGISARRRASRTNAAQ
ncbi:MAG: TRAP transporter large permease subunit [Pseudomonadota bacterium]